MNGSLLFEILKRSKENKEIISINLHSDEEGFWAGYVLDYNEEVVSIQHFTKYGKPDGIKIESISNLKYIDTKDDYSICLQYIIENAKELDKEVAPALSLISLENWQYETLKQVEQNRNVMVRIEYDDDFCCGFVKKVSPMDFILHRVEATGDSDGQVLYSMEDITGIKINDLENRKRMLLYKWKQSSR